MKCKAKKAFFAGKNDIYHRWKDVYKRQRLRTVLPLLYTTKLRRRSRRICLPDLMHVVRC